MAACILALYKGDADQDSNENVITSLFLWAHVVN